MKTYTVTVNNVTVTRTGRTVTVTNSTNSDVMKMKLANRWLAHEVFNQVVTKAKALTQK